MSHPNRRPPNRPPNVSPFAVGCANAIPYVIIGWTIILITLYIIAHL